MIIKRFPETIEEVEACEDALIIEQLYNYISRLTFINKKSKTMVRAKFLVSHIAKHDDGSISVHAHPVASGSEENKAFNDYTPGGELRLHIAADKPAQDQFIQGNEYYVDFTEAPKEPAA